MQSNTLDRWRMPLKLVFARMVGVHWLILPACFVVAVLFLSGAVPTEEQRKKPKQQNQAVIDRRCLVMTYDPPTAGLCRSVGRLSTSNAHK